MDQSMLAPLFNYCFPTWLQHYCERLISLEKQGTPMGDHETYDVIMKLLGTATRDRNNVRRVEESDTLVTLIAVILQHSSEENARYISCLELIDCLAN